MEEKLGLEHLENLPQTLTSAGKESNTDFRECFIVRPGSTAFSQFYQMS